MTCPYLKEVVMLYCDAYPLKKMVPLDRLVSAEPCLARHFEGCPLFRRTAEAAEPEDKTREQGPWT
jgi:hypothetical protein